MSDTLDMIRACFWGQGYREDADRACVQTPIDDSRPAERLETYSRIEPEDTGRADHVPLPPREDVASGVAQ